jgi:hypothetical protein
MLVRLAWCVLVAVVALDRGATSALRKAHRPGSLLNHARTTEDPHGHGGSHAHSADHGEPHSGTKSASSEGGHAAAGEHAEEHAEHAEGSGHGVHPLDSHGDAAHEERAAEERSEEWGLDIHEDQGVVASMEAGECSGAGSVAVGLFATTILLPWAFSMIMYGGVVSKLTWRFVDFFVSVFLAILWFGAFSDVLNLRYFVRSFSPTALTIIQVFILYVLAMTIAYFLRDNQFRLLAFAGCGAHYVAFAGIAAGEHTQREFFSEAMHMPFILTAIVLAVLAMVFSVGFQWRSNNLSERFNHVADEIELDIAGLVTSYLLTQSVRTLLSGSYPAPHGDVHEHHHHGPDAWQRWMMFGWALFLVTSCMVGIPHLHYWGREGIHQHRVSHFAKVLLIMSSSWAFLLWGEWEFHASFDGDPLFGKMVFALMGTAICLLIILFVARLVNEEDFRTLEAAEIGVTGLSLVAAWSWEHCFDMALSTIGADYDVGYGGIVPKCTLALLVPGFVLPVYVNYIKPQVVRIEEEEEEAEERAYGHIVGTPFHHKGEEERPHF